jgi:toxin YhaV
VIVYAWVNDERSLRQRGGRTDPYEVFRRMLASGNPPNDWTALVRSAGTPSLATLPEFERDE